jgi:hypothetical protein
MGGPTVCSIRNRIRTHNPTAGGSTVCSIRNRIRTHNPTAGGSNPLPHPTRHPSGCLFASDRRFLRLKPLLRGHQSQIRLPPLMPSYSLLMCLRNSWQIAGRSRLTSPGRTKSMLTSLQLEVVSGSRRCLSLHRPGWHHVADADKQQAHSTYPHLADTDTWLKLQIWVQCTVLALVQL